MEALTFSALVFSVYASALGAIAYCKRDSLDIGRIVYVNIIVMYCAVLFVMSLFPYAPEELGGLYFAPVAEWLRADKAAFGGLLLRGLTGFLLYLPLGFLSDMHSKLKGEPALLKTVLLALTVSVTAEFLQLVLPYGRTCSIDDVLINLIGAMAGYGIFQLALRGRAMPAVMKNILYR